jgi:ABC-type multidrug transport system fused ATPase/permease subunit
MSTQKNETVTIRSDEHQRTIYYSSFYVVVSLVMCLEGTIRYIFVFRGSLRASRSMFKDLTYSIIRAPLRWLDTVPVGRILNRFTADFNSVDSSQAYGMSYGFWNFLQVLGISIAG